MATNHEATLQNGFHKRQLSKGQRILRLFGSIIDPRAFIHLLKIINFYNYSHVQPMRKILKGTSNSISPDVSFTNAERIKIGNRVRIGSRCSLWAGPKNGTIEISDDVLFGPEVMVTAATYRYNDGHPVTDQLMDESDIFIGKDVWLGTRAVILPGAHIGDGVIIAAGSIVKGKIPPMSIYAGSPAKKVGERAIIESTSNSTC